MLNKDNNVLFEYSGGSDTLTCDWVRYSLEFVGDVVEMFDFTLRENFFGVRESFDIKLRLDIDQQLFMEAFLFDTDKALTIDSTTYDVVNANQKINYPQWGKTNYAIHPTLKFRKAAMTQLIDTETTISFADDLDQSGYRSIVTYGIDIQGAIRENSAYQLYEDYDNMRQIIRIESRLSLSEVNTVVTFLKSTQKILNLNGQEISVVMGSKRVDFDLFKKSNAFSYPQLIFEKASLGLIDQMIWVTEDDDPAKDNIPIGTEDGDILILG